jgi:integrase/recombinase XerD
VARTKSPLSNVKIFRDRHGKLRHAFRVKGRKLVPLPGKYGSPEFMAAYQLAHHDAFGGPAPTLAVIPKTIRRRIDAEGTIEKLVTQYLASQTFAGLSAETQQGRRRTLERFRADHGDKSLFDIQPQHIIALMDDISGGAHPQRNWLKHISGMFLFAEEKRIRLDNPCRGFRRPKAPETEGHHTWTADEIAKFRAHWKYGTHQRLVLEMALDTSARRGDVTRLGPSHLIDGRMEFRHNKNKVEVSIPLGDELREAIMAMPKTNQLTFLRTKDGEPRSAKSLGNDFREWCDVAGLPKRCTIHGLRKACLQIRADAGSTVFELQAIGGHKTLSELQKYVAKYDRRAAADRSAKKLAAHKAKVA